MLDVQLVRAPVVSVEASWWDTVVRTEMFNVHQYTTDVRRALTCVLLLCVMQNGVGRSSCSEGHFSVLLVLTARLSKCWNQVSVKSGLG